jgi:acyl-CoA thioesterase
MTTLSDAYTPRPVGDRYELEVVEGWRQGRGAFGGLVVAALMKAIDLKMADPARTIRTVTAEIPGPVEHGVVEIAVEPLRHGKNVSTLRAALSQHGEIRSHAVAILAAARPGLSSVGWNDLARPAAPDWAEVEPVAMRGPGGWPEFAQHFEYRMVEGVPMSGGTPRVVGWIRPRDPGPARDAAFIAAVADAWWPTPFIRFTTRRPMATIAFTLDIIGGFDGLDPAAPLLYRATAPVCSDGFFLETRELWGADGRLVAINQQTFAIIQ